MDLDTQDNLLEQCIFPTVCKKVLKLKEENKFCANRICELGNEIARLSIYGHTKNTILTFFQFKENVKDCNKYAEYGIHLKHIGWQGYDLNSNMIYIGQSYYESENIDTRKITINKMYEEYLQRVAWDE